MILISIFDIHITLCLLGYQFQSYVHNLFFIFDNELANKIKNKLNSRPLFYLL